MDDRAPVVAAFAGVLAPVLTVHLVGMGIQREVLHPFAGLAILYVLPLLLVAWTISAGWKLGIRGWDPFERFRRPDTVRGELPDQYHDAFTAETLSEPTDDGGGVPTLLFVGAIVYGLAVPLFALVVLL